MSTPSSFAQPTVWAIEQMENPLILNHHPSSAFGLPSMSETFKDEEKCKKKLHNMLGKYLGTVFQEVGFRESSTTDGSRDPELGLGAGCPYVQASSYYADFILHHRKNSAVKVINQSCCPTFLLHLTGPYLGIAGAVLQTRSFQLNNGNISSFAYIKQIDGKLVFVVESKGNCTIVKFSRRYPKDIHLKCSELGLTPKLITINNLEGADCIKSAVEKTVNRFHNAGFVHGNMHANNIFGYLNCSKIHIKIVGLSWAGYEGKARYPFFLKKDKIQRDEGATDGNLITKEHDRYLINQIFTKKH
ncbi:9984_t:CDS:2 [Entrophospora sp. SA101]|nr:9984_t:CDS:2 [Entrophospora sp. SA101]